MLYLDQLHQAMAARNSGGLVIVQVERVVDRHSLPSRAVHLHASLVDLVRARGVGLGEREGEGSTWMGLVPGESAEGCACAIGWSFRPSAGTIPGSTPHRQAPCCTQIVVAEAADHPQSYAPGAYDGALRWAGQVYESQFDFFWGGGPAIRE